MTVGYYNRNYYQTNPNYYNYPPMTMIERKPKEESSGISTGKVITGLAAIGTAAYLVKSGKGKAAVDTVKKYFTSGKGAEYVAKAKTAGTKVTTKTKDYFTTGKGSEYVAKAKEAGTKAIDKTKTYFTEGSGKKVWNATKGAYETVKGKVVDVFNKKTSAPANVVNPFV